MGVLYDSITALYADQSLTNEQRNAQKLALKASAYRDSLLSKLPYTVKLDATRQLVIHSLWLTGTTIRMVVTFTSNGVVIADKRVWNIVNPPVLVPAANGEVTIGSVKYKEDLALSLLEIARNTWK